MKTIIIILFHCSFAIVLLLFGYIILPNGQLPWSLNQKENTTATYVIMQFYIEKGEIRTHKAMETFSDYEAARKRLQAYAPAGFFWTGLHEYKIVRQVGGVYQECYNGTDLHLKHLTKP